MMQNFLENVWVRNLVLPVLLFFLFFLISVPAANALFRLMKKISEKSGGSWGEKFDFGFHKPLHGTLIAVGIYIALASCPAVWQNIGARGIIIKCFRSFLVLAVTWGFYRMADSIELSDTPLAKKLDFEVDEALLPVFSGILHFILIALAVLIVAQEWNFSISGLVAGLGLGGLAFALAAKDMLANLFGGLVILIDRPFAIGDWIRTGDVEGSVENINFRSLKVRTLEQSLVSVPNATVASTPVINYSRQGKRRVEFTLTVAYSTAASKLQACSEMIRRWLMESEEIEDGTSTVSLNALSENGMELSVVYFTKTTDLKEFLRVRETVYYAVLKILEKENVKLARPNTIILPKKGS
jgi:MscS family membrane protein